MGNNNTFLANDRNPNDAIIWPKDVKRAMDEITKKKTVNCDRNYGKSEINNTDEPLENKKSFQHVSPTQRIFLDNVIIPAANEINAKVQQRRILDRNTDQSIEKIIPILENNRLEIPKDLDVSMFSRSPNQSFQITNRNVEAIILKHYDSKDQKEYPAVFRFNGKAKEVFVTGSFNNWNRTKMTKSKDSNSFIAIMDLAEGDYEYQYIVEPEEDSSNRRKIGNKLSAKINSRAFHGERKQVMNVHKDNYDVFQALDMDSFSVSRRKGRRNEDLLVSEEDGYSQNIPNYSTRTYMSRSPPIIPPHLLHFMLNKKPIRNVSSEYPELLPKPCHTLLNHLYVTAMNDGVMASSSTQRYRRKFVTTIFYCPVPER